MFFYCKYIEYKELKIIFGIFLVKEENLLHLQSEKKLTD